MEYLFIYLMQCCDALKGLTIGIALIALFLLLLTVPFNIMEHGESKVDEVKKPIVISLIAIILSGFIPSKDTFLLMSSIYLGKSVSKQVVQSEKWQKLNKIIDLEMDHYLEDIEKAYQNKQQQRH